jgi:plastocyanin
MDPSSPFPADRAVGRTPEGSPVRRRLVVLVAVGVIALTALGCSRPNTSPGTGNPITTDEQPTVGVPAEEGPQPTAASNVVGMKDGRFEPASIEVKAGQLVTWTNNDTASHTVTADSGGFDLVLKARMSGKRRFNTPGTINYYCRIHPLNPRMHGRVVVS